MSSTDIFQKPADGQNNITISDIRSLKGKVNEKNPRKTNNLQLGRSSQEKLECPDCQEKSGSTPRGLKMHRRIHCKNRRPGIFCFICDEAFSTKSSLRWHTMRKCGKTGGKDKQNNSSKAFKSNNKEDVSASKNPEHVHTECVPDEEIPKDKVMITVEFTSDESKKSRLRWKVAVRVPIQRILEKVRAIPCL